MRELLLVDDASDRAYLGAKLDEHLAHLSAERGLPARTLRVPERAGLIRARLRGAREAKGEAIVFLDAHCEVTKGWMEPLLHRLVYYTTTL